MPKSSERRKTAEARIVAILDHATRPAPKPGKQKAADIRAELDALACELGFTCWSDFSTCARRRRITLPQCPPEWVSERHTKPRKKK